MRRCTVFNWPLGRLWLLLILGSIPTTLGKCNSASGGPRDCTLDGVRVVRGANKNSRYATDCIKPRDMPRIRKTWKNTSDYSYGGLDDFCLHTQISDSKGLRASRQRMYRGVGSDFWVLQKLQRGNAWSFQRNGPIETVNMDFKMAKVYYDRYMTLKTIYEEWALKYERNISMWKEVKGLYKQRHLEWNGTEEMRTVLEWMQLEVELVENHVEYDRFTFPPIVGLPLLHVDNNDYIKAPLPPGGSPIQADGTDHPDYFCCSKRYPIWRYFEFISYMAEYDAETLIAGRNHYRPYRLPIENIRVEVEHTYGKVKPDSPLYQRKVEYEQQAEKDYRLIVIDPRYKLIWVYNKYRDWMTLRYQIDGRRIIHHGYSAMEQLRRQNIVDSCKAHAKAVKTHFADLEYLVRNVKGNPFKPDPLAPNPYFVEVSGVKVNGAVLKNFLHIRVFMNRSVSDVKQRLHSEKELKHQARGRMKAVIIIVKDQEGFPVGDFSRPVPCDWTCDHYSGPIKKHNTYRNDIPCVYTPPTANQHPGIFVWPGSEQENSTDIDYEGVREVHATWNFVQDSCNFVTELHIQTIIMEDLEVELPGTDRFKKCDLTNQPQCVKIEPGPCKFTFKHAYDIPEYEGASARTAVSFEPVVYSYNSTDSYGNITRYNPGKHGKGISARPMRPSHPPYQDTLLTNDECNTHWDVNRVDGIGQVLERDCPNVGRGHLFGWTARYNVIHPTLESLGAPDYVDIQELRKKEGRGTHINCHVPLGEVSQFIKGKPAGRMDAIPSMAPYFLELMAEFGQELQDLDVLYYGTHYRGRLQCREPKLSTDASELAVSELKRILAPPPVRIFMDKPGIRCPCPALPTTPDPDSATVDPSRLHGRLLHASHMALAWMLLLPLSIFVVRYYKETFSLVFCVQEYWWYAWHVGLLFGSVAFVLGGILAVRTRRSGVDIKWTEEMLVHQIFGIFSIALFYIQIITGFFRSSDPMRRIRQIFAHWVLGMLNQASAVVAIIMMGFVKESGMSCNALYTAAAWAIFYVLMFVIMEVHMRANDKLLNLDPPRSYHPPPVKRLFGRDAPHRNFRIVMLGVFVIGMITFYILMAYFLWYSAGVSCQNEKEKTLEGAGAGGTADDDYSYYA